jgi:hypothetical protein
MSSPSANRGPAALLSQMMVRPIPAQIEHLSFVDEGENAIDAHLLRLMHGNIRFFLRPSQACGEWMHLTGSTVKIGSKRGHRKSTHMLQTSRKLAL